MRTEVSTTLKFVVATPYSGEVSLLRNRIS
jgi:hypothetical protein